MAEAAAAASSAPSSSSVPAATPTLTTQSSSSSAVATTSAPSTPSPASSSSVSPAATPVADWSCEKCTYANKAADAKCTVCNEGVRPASTPSPAASPAPDSKSADAKKDEDDDAPASKKKSSYYFFSSTPKEEAHKYAPKPIEAAAATAPPVNRVGSAWNTAGTWEEKDLSKVAKDKLKEIFEKGVDVPGLPNGTLKFSSCTKCDGEASVVVTRGKKKLGYELKVTVNFKATHNGADVDGSVDIPDLEDSNDGDYQLNVSCSNSEVRSFVRGQSAQNVLRKTIDTFLTDLKNH